MDDEKLILLVRDNECLFDAGHKDYNDSNVKMVAWKEIGDEMGLSGGDCKQRWFSLRDQYRRAARSKRRSSGRPTSRRRKWRFEDEMSFLQTEEEVGGPSGADAAEPALDAFLAGVGETLKTFPAVLRHSAKAGIFRLVSDLEMELLARRGAELRPNGKRYRAVSETTSGSDSE